MQPFDPNHGPSSGLSPGPTTGFSLFPLEPRRIGLAYLLGGTLALLAGALAAVAVQAERLTSGPTVNAPDGFARLYAAHGVVMVHLFLVPTMSAVLGNLLLPGQLGARNVAFPRLNLLSLWLYVIGAMVLAGGLTAGGADQHWAFDTPAGPRMDAAALTSMVGVFLLAVSAMLTGLNFLVTLTIRPNRAPVSLFGWGLGLAAATQLVSTPVLGITLIGVVAERTFDAGLFDPTMGADAQLFRQFSWFFGHATAYATLLPAAGLVSDLLNAAVRDGRVLLPRKVMALAMATFGLLELLDWGQHLMFAGQSAFANTVVSLIGLLALVPATLLAASWISLLFRGGLTLGPPVLWALGFVLLFSGGVASGLFTTSLATGGPLAASTFAPAHFHFFVAGAGLLAIMAGLHHAWSASLERGYGRGTAMGAAVLTFVGLNAVFVPLFLMGLSGMPRRMDDALPGQAGWHTVVLMGGLTLVGGLLLAVVNLARGMRAARPATVDTGIG